MIALHPGAAKAIDSRAGDLIRAITEHSEAPSAKGFETERPVVALTEKDIIGPIRFGQVDITHAHVSRFFSLNDKTFGLADEGYQRLVAVADLFLKDKPIAAAIGREGLEERIFDWCESAFKAGEIKSSLSSYVVDAVNSSIEDLELWYPVAEMEVQAEFFFGPYRVTPLSKEVVDQMSSKTLERVPPVMATIVQRKLDVRRQELQGRAAIVVNISAERSHAYLVGLEAAEKVLDVMRFFCGSGVTPWRTSACMLMGAEKVRRTEIIAWSKGEYLGFQNGIRDSGIETWRISNEDSIRSEGFKIAECLVEESGLTPFQLNLLQSIRMFSKGCASPDLNDRLIYTFSALEALFVKDNEPIQQNLGERLAFLNHKDPVKRRGVVATVKNAYDLRSKYVHKSTSASEAHALEEIMICAWTSIYMAIQDSKKFQTPKDYIDAIDGIKFGDMRRSE